MGYAQSATHNLNRHFAYAVAACAQHVVDDTPLAPLALRPEPPKLVLELAHRLDTPDVQLALLGLAVRANRVRVVLRRQRSAAAEARDLDDGELEEAADGRRRKRDAARMITG